MNQHSNFYARTVMPLTSSVDVGCNNDVHLVGNGARMRKNMLHHLLTFALT